MTKVAVLGAGQIGRAVYQILTDLIESPDPSTFGQSQYHELTAFVIDANEENLAKMQRGIRCVMDLASIDASELTQKLFDLGVTHVINALPFFLNEKVALATAAARCHYIDFTEDDIMADKVQEIYKGTGLTCAVKCGLAPGFINYVGLDLAAKIAQPETLTISVGALPRTVSYDSNHPEHSYNLTWSVDGLVNEYIRPCRVREYGVEQEIAALDGHITVILDGLEYEAAYTSGGIGSLIKDLPNVPNVHYKTLRYPGHYDYVRGIVSDNNGDFEKIKKVFTEKFAFTDDDVILVYANAIGKDTDGSLIRRSYSNKFYGANGLTGIQSTTAGAGVAIFELMLSGKVSGIVNHANVPFSKFTKTRAFREYYNLKR